MRKFGFFIVVQGGKIITIIINNCIIINIILTEIWVVFEAQKVYLDVLQSFSIN